MKERPCAALAASLHSNRFAWAMTALVMMGAASGPAANAQPANGESSNYCLLVKDAAARALCQTSRQQFYGKNYRAALVTMKKAVDASPKEGITHVMIARIAAVFNNVGEEERELREARQLGAPDYAVLPQLFAVLIQRHDENRLLSEFADPGPGAKGDTAGYILHGRANALLSLGRADEAAAQMDLALGLRRDIPSLLDRGRIAAKQNNKALANKLIDEAYKLNPQDGMAAFAKLKQIRDTENAAKTLAFSEQMVKDFPNRMDVKIVRIETFLKLKQDAKAQAEVDALTKLAPNSPYGIYYKALLLVHANDKKGAWQLLLQLPPAFLKENPAFGSVMAQVAIDTGHVDAGGSILATALSAAPDLLDVRLDLAALRLRQNTPQSALTVLTPVKDSHDPRVQKLLAQIQGQIAKDRSF